MMSRSDRGGSFRARPGAQGWRATSRAAYHLQPMAPLGALSQAWVSAEAALPLGWQISGLWRFGDLWVALSEGPAFEDYRSGTGRHADQALRRLSDRLRERRGLTTG
jgi:hypothetical protein